MTGGGESFETGDGLSYTRLNTKSVFVGTGAEIGALSPTYPGMRVFCTSTSGAFTVDTAYERNAANNTWNTWVSRFTLITTSERSTTPITDNTNFTPTANRRYFAYFQLPNSSSDPPYYFITKLEWKNGSAVAGNILTGVSIVDAIPPTLKYHNIVCIGPGVAQAGIDTTQDSTIASCFPIKAGTIIGAWVQSSSASSRFRTLAAQSNQSYEQTGTTIGGATISNLNAWIASTERIYLKIYYRGIR